MKMVRVDGSVAMATLAANDVVGGDLTQVSNEAYRVLSLKALWSLRGLTSGEGPIVYGVAHGDYTDAEIEECLENDGSLTRGDKIAAEQSNRLVRRIGQFDGNAAEIVEADGRPVSTRLNWLMATGDALRLWAWNKSGATLTTGGLVLINGNMLIKWV